MRQPCLSLENVDNYVYMLLHMPALLLFCHCMDCMEDIVMDRYVIVLIQLTTSKRWYCISQFTASWKLIPIKLRVTLYVTQLS